MGRSRTGGERSVSPVAWVGDARYLPDSLAANYEVRHTIQNFVTTPPRPENEGHKLPLLLSCGSPVHYPTSSHRNIGDGLQNQRTMSETRSNTRLESEQAEPAQSTAHEKHHNRAEPCLKHNSGCGDRDCGGLPTGIG